jgi:hypothetical protein
MPVSDGLSRYIDAPMAWHIADRDKHAVLLVRLHKLIALRRQSAVVAGNGINGII